MPKHLFNAVTVLALAAPLLAQSAEMATDRAHRDIAIHWPAAYNPDMAPVFSHNEFLIHTDCHRAFTRLADATTWPDWFPLVKDVTIEGTDKSIREGTLLHLKIFNTPINSRITEFSLDQRISWVPFGADETETNHGHFHTWHFIPQSTTCLVITEETGIAAYDRKDPVAAAHYMHKAHDLWLAGLKYASEP